MKLILENKKVSGYINKIYEIDGEREARKIPVLHVDLILDYNILQSLEEEIIKDILYKAIKG